MTALPQYEHVEISGGVIERPYVVPKYVDQTMAFWGWWQRHIKAISLELPNESILSRMRRERDGAAYGNARVSNEDFDILGEKIDRVVCELSNTMIEICKQHYIYGVGISIAADRMYEQWCAYETTKEAWREIIRRTYHGATWYLAAGLKEPARRLELMNVFYF